MELELNGKVFVPLFSKEEVAERVRTVAQKIDEYYKDKNPLFVSVLNGSFIFSADLIRALSIESEITFIKVHSYHGINQTGEVEEILGLEKDIQGRHLVFLEDIVDTGVTMSALLKQIKEYQPASVEVCCLLSKPSALVKPISLKFVGAEIENKFVVGYGLDFDGKGRNLSGIWQLKEQTIA